MKTSNQNRKAQRGFFDLGLAVILLTVFSSAGYVATTIHEAEEENKKLTMQVQQLKQASANMDIELTPNVSE